MKKVIFATAVFVAALLQFYSQKASAQFAVQGGIGYNLGAPGDLIGENENNGTTTAAYGSYGAGLNLNVQATDNLSCCPMIEYGLGVDFQFGAKHTFTNTSSESGSTFTDMTTDNVNMLSITPRIGMHVNCGSKFTPYAYYGPMIGIPLSAAQVQTDANTSGGTTDLFEEDSKTTGKLSIGLTGAIGARVPFTKKLDIYAEVGYNYMNFYPNVRTVNTYTVNGTSELSLLTKSEIETDYVKSISSTDNTSADQPSKSILDPITYSGFRINAGVRYGF
jgi:hypothetical protein